MKGETIQKPCPCVFPEDWSTPCPPFSQGIPAALQFFLTSQLGKCWSHSRFQGRRLLCCPTLPPCADSVRLLADLSSVAPHVNSWPFGRGTALEQQWEAEDDATNTQLCWFSSCGVIRHNEIRKQALETIRRDIAWVGLDPREAQQVDTWNDSKTKPHKAKCSADPCKALTKLCFFANQKPYGTSMRLHTQKFCHKPAHPYLCAFP